MFLKCMYDKLVVRMLQNYVKIITYNIVILFKFANGCVIVQLQ